MTTSSTATAPRGRHAAKRPEPTKGTHWWWTGGKGGRRWWIGGAAVLAGFAYAPLLAVRPGVVTPDTKTYLYLDPTRFLSQVAFMWNPTVGLGTVSHEYIGYLLPMGPFFAAFHVLGVPVWVAQRLWLGSILFAAGLGVLYLSRILGLRGPGPAAAALAYMLSPYFLQYSGRISVILLPWAGLPVMLGLTIVALRRGGWREPALFAVVVAIVSGINASSIIYVGIGPVLWLLYAVVVLRESTWRHALGTALRIALLTLGACVWWMAGLQVEAAYGVNVLKFTETVPSTSATSNSADIVRGLGYWYFYGADHLGSWTNAAIRYTQDIGLLATSFAVPVVALVVAAFVRWRERAYFLVLLFVGLVLSVGPFPFSDPTVIGRQLKAFMTDTTAGLALRSTDRATRSCCWRSPCCSRAASRRCGTASPWPASSWRCSSRASWWRTTPPSSSATPSPTTSPSRRRCPPTSRPPSTTSTQRTPAPASSPSRATTSRPTAGATRSTLPRPRCSTGTS